MATLLVLATGCAAARWPPTMRSTSLAFRESTIRSLVFVPASYQASRPLPVLLLLHGAGGEGGPMVLAWQRLADEQGILLVAPTLSLTAEQETHVPELLPAIVDSVRERWAVDERRVYVFGYSAGGYFAFDAAAFSASTFAAAAVFGATITKEYEWIASQPGKKAPVAIYLGDRDRFWTLDDGRATARLLEEHGFPVRFVALPGQGHDYLRASAEVNRDAWAFLARYSLPPVERLPPAPVQ
jgi:poly(3-hydroxybutyrate) depolymerase